MLRHVLSSTCSTQQPREPRMSTRLAVLLSQPARTTATSRRRIGLCRRMCSFFVFSGFHWISCFQHHGTVTSCKDMLGALGALRCQIPRLKSSDADNDGQPSADFGIQLLCTSRCAQFRPCGARRMSLVPTAVDAWTFSAPGATRRPLTRRMLRRNE